ncbi:hypothetical protein CapIbe_021547 [Capra ibex]
MLVRTESWGFCLLGLFLETNSPLQSIQDTLFPAPWSPMFFCLQNRCGRQKSESVDRTSFAIRQSRSESSFRC